MPKDEGDIRQEALGLRTLGFSDEWIAGYLNLDGPEEVVELAEGAIAQAEEER